MLRVVLCEDDERVTASVKRYCEKYLQERNIEIEFFSFKTGEELVNQFDTMQNINIYFLDIVLGKMNGLEVAAFIRKRDQKVCIFFLTSRGQYSLEGYKVQALDYIKKPMSYERFVKEIENALKQIEQEEQVYLVEKNDEGIFKIYLKDIIYIETKNRNTLIHTVNDEIISYKKMKYHENNLDSRFYRCHAGYIVNMAYVKKVQNNLITLRKTSEIISLAKNRKKKFMEQLTIYFCQQL